MYGVPGNAGYPTFEDNDFAQQPTMDSPLMQAAAQKGYGVAEGVSTEIYDKLDFTKMLPSIFTFGCFIMFLPPIMMTAHMGNDVNILYWMGPWCQFVVLLPFVFFFGHIIHVRKRPPYKPVVLACLMIPCVVLLGLNDAVERGASQKADELLSADCRTVTGKMDLEQSWAEAYQLYTSCVADFVEKAGGNRTQVPFFKVQDCPKYAAAFAKRKESWTYLRSLEEVYRCSGWCSYGPKLWTYRSTQDSCSSAAGQVFKAKIGLLSHQAMMYTVVVLMVTSILFILAGSALQKRGYEW